MLRTKKTKFLSLLLSIGMIATMITVPLTANAAIPASTVGVTYQAHVQSIGWQTPVSNGAEAGTDGQAKRVEAIKIGLSGAPAGASIIYQAHVQSYGWQAPVSNGAEAGTDGKAKRVEALKITLSGLPGYEVQYRAHVQSYGWMAWQVTANGTAIAAATIAGTEGKAKRVEAIQINVVKTAAEIAAENAADAAVSAAETAKTTATVAAANTAIAAVQDATAKSAFTARVNAIVITATITSIIPVAVSTVAGTAPVIPTTVTAVYSDGTTKSATATWAVPTASQYAAAGSFAVSGTVAGTTVTATANVTVTAAVVPAVISINAITVTTTAETAPTLPATVTATMSDGTTKSVSVTWATIDATKYATDGSFTVSGTIAESSTVKATATITVGTTAVSVAPVTASIPVNTSTAFKFVDSTGKTVIPTNVTYSVTSTNAATGFFNSTGVFSASTAGVYTIQAVIGTTKATTSVTVYGTATNLIITPTTPLVANGVSKETIVVTAVDVNGSVVANFNSNVNIVLGASLAFGGTYTSTVAAVKGVATFDVTSNGQLASTSQQINVSSTSGIIGDLASISLVAPIATTVTIAPTFSSIAEAAAGSTIGLTATLRDQTGTPISGNVTVAVSSSAVAVATVSPTLLSFGSSATASANVSYVAPGTVSIIPGTVQVNGNTVTTVSVNTISVTFSASSFASKIASTTTAPASTFVAGTAQTLKTIVTDASGIVKGSYAGTQPTLTIFKADGTTLSTSTGTYSSGVSTFNINVNTAGSYTYTVTDTDKLLTSSVSGSFAVTPGAATQLTTVTPSVAIIKADGVSTSTLSVKVLDAYSNLVTSSSLAVTFVKTTNHEAAALPATTTVNAVNGIASIVVTSKTTNTDPTALLSDAIGASATINSATVTAASGTISTQYPLTANKLLVSPMAQTISAGDNAVFTVNVLDVYNTAVLTDNSTSVTVTLKDATGNVLGTGTATASSGVANVNVALTKAGTFTAATVSATASSLVTGTATGNITVNPNAAASLTITPNLTSAASLTDITFTIGTKDKYGNVNTAVGTTPAVTITASSKTYGTFAGSTATWTAPLVAGTVTSDAWHIFNISSFGPTTFTVSATNLTSATTTVTSVYTQDANSIVASGATAATAGASQTVTFNVVDVNGNVVTTLNGTVLLKIEAATGSIKTGSIKVNGAIPTDITTVSLTITNGTVSFAVSDTNAQTLKYTLTYNTLSGNISGTFNPGAAVKVLLSDSGTAKLKNDGSSIIKVTATLADAYDNAVGAGNGNVTFSVTTDGSPAVPRATIVGNTTVIFVSGTATVTIQSASGKAVDSTFAVTAKPADTNIAQSAPYTITYIA